MLNPIKKIPFLLSCIPLLLVSCTSTVFDESDKLEKVPISFSVQPETRGAVIKLEDMTDFKVWGWRKVSSDSEYISVFNGVNVTKNSGWDYEGGDIYWNMNEYYDFYAVHPNNITADVTNSGSITINDFDCSKTGADAVDLMTASRTGMNGSAPEEVALTFNHELAKVNIIVTSEGDAVNITNAKVYGISHIGTLKNKQWTVGDSSTEGKPSFSGSLNIPEADIQPHELFGGSLLLIPTSAEKLANAILSFDYQYEDGTSESAKIDLKRDPIQEWLAGSQYKYTITIPRSTEELKLEVTVLPWTKEENTSVEW